MDTGAYAIGQAVFIRTDTPDFQEKAVPFASLEEMVNLCTQPRPNLTLEKIIVHCLSNEEPVAVTLGFISASKGARPGKPGGISEKSPSSQPDKGSKSPGTHWPY